MTTYASTNNTPSTMNTKHTPGPWEQGTQIKGSTTLVARMETGFVVAEMRNVHFREEAEANARLISAAPCLLAFAQKVSDGGHDMADLMTEARSVIAKATGNTNL